MNAGQIKLCLQCLDTSLARQQRVVPHIKNQRIAMAQLFACDGHKSIRQHVESDCLVGMGNDIACRVDTLPFHTKGDAMDMTLRERHHQPQQSSDDDNAQIKQQRTPHTAVTIGHYCCQQRVESSTSRQS